MWLPAIQHHLNLDERSTPFVIPFRLALSGRIHGFSRCLSSSPFRSSAWSMAPPSLGAPIRGADPVSRMVNAYEKIPSWFPLSDFGTRGHGAEPWPPKTRPQPLIFVQTLACNLFKAQTYKSDTRGSPKITAQFISSSSCVSSSKQQPLTPATSHTSDLSYQLLRRVNPENKVVS